MPLGDREHVDQRAVDEPEAVGADSLQEVPSVDWDVREQDDRDPDGAPASDAWGAAHGKGAELPRPSPTGSRLRTPAVTQRGPLPTRGLFLLFRGHAEGSKNRACKACG